MKKISLLFLLFGLQLGISQERTLVPDSLLLGRYSLKMSGEDFQLQPEAATAFESMRVAALKDSIVLKVVSSFRDYATQKRIWNRKYKRFTAEGMPPEAAIEKIIEYSTLPGTSRHHWGTDIDLVLGDIEVKGDVLLEEHFHQGGPYEKLRLWMEKNASTFGFILVYTNDEERKGFHYEPWHYSYAPLSISYLKRYSENYLLQKMTKDTTLLGHKHLNKEFLNQYFKENILDVNPLLKKL